MKAVLSVFVLLVCVVAGWQAFEKGYPPFNSWLVRSCDAAIKERLKAPSTYRRASAAESQKAITFEEYFADNDSYGDAARRLLVSSATEKPIQFIAVLEYEAQNSLGVPLRAMATCTFNALSSNEQPGGKEFVKLDGKTNVQWLVRQVTDAKAGR